MYCSIQCRNEVNARAQQPKRPKTPTDNPPEGKRSWRMCPKCNHVGFRGGNYCFTCIDRVKIWTPENDQQLRELYLFNGATKTAEIMGLEYKQVLNRAGILGLVLDKDVFRELVHDSASEYMTENNPMFNPETVKKVQQYYVDNPDAKHKRDVRIMKGKQRIQRNKPTKLEIKLFDILTEFSVHYEPFFIVKDKLIVDCRIEHLIIQADGEYWHGHPRFEPLTDRQIAQRKRDSAQDKYLAKCGYIVERIWERDMTTENVRDILHKHGLLS